MANNRKIYIDIIANDDASSVFRQVSHGIGAFASDANNSISKFNNALRGYGNAMYSFNHTTKMLLFEAGDAISNFVEDSIRKFAQLEQNHAKTMGAIYNNYAKTAEGQRQFYADSDALRTQAIKLGSLGPDGNGSMYDAQEISYAQTALVKAGVDPKEVITTDAISNVIKFAGGNDLSLENATEFAVSLGTQFEVPMEQWGDMLDKVTRAADISIVDVEDIMESMKYAGGIASGLKRPMEEILGMIAVMGNAGLKGSMSGTGIQGVLSRVLATGGLSDLMVGKAPGIAGNVYNSFKSQIVDENDNLLPMEDVTPLLNDAMEMLNDTEQAWFAKKLFGLFQMKAAYALGREGKDGEGLLKQAIDDINNMSDGTIDAKWQLMLGSMYGNIEALKNAWNSTKTDVGGRLSPMVKSISTELFNFLSNDGNYDINFDTLRESIKESGKLISEQYGEQLGKLVEDAGNFGLDVGMVAGAVAPTGAGIAGFTLKFLAGDFDGAFESLYDGLENTNENIEDLPVELQDLATNTNRAAVALSALAGLNFIAKILESATTVWRYSGGKLLSHITTPKANITSASSSMTSGSITATIANFNGTANIMNVNAGIVNINGGKGGKGGSGGGGTGGSPTGGIGGAGMAGGTLLAAAGARGLLGSSGKPPLLTGSGSGSPINMTRNPFNGKYFYPNQMLMSLLKKGGTLAALYGTAKISTSPGLFDSASKRAEDGSGNIDRYVSDVGRGAKTFNRNDKLDSDAYMMYYAKEHPDYNGANAAQIIADTINGRLSAREEMMNTFKTGDGIQYFTTMMNEQIKENGRVTEQFLQGLLTHEKDGYTYTGTQEDLEELLGTIYTNFDKFNQSFGGFFGRFNDDAVNSFVKDNSNIVSVQTDTINTVADSIKSAIEGVNIDNAITVLPPNVKVNVNVDKSGNVRKDILTDYSPVTSWIHTQGNRYSG